MMKRMYAFLAVTMMLATAAPVAAPAMTVQAASYVGAEKTVSPLSDKAAARFVEKNGNTYCLQSDGTQKTGWVLDAGKWYYFDKSDGHMLKGWLRLGNKKFYLRTDGSMVQGPGWYMISGKKYFFTKNGHVRSAWEKIGGKWYYRNTEGDTVKGRWICYGGNYYYLKKNGDAATGTVSINGREYTFSSSCDLMGAVPSNVVASAKAYEREEAQKLNKIKTAVSAKNITIKDSEAVVAKTEETKAEKTDDTGKTAPAKTTAKTSTGSSGAKSTKKTTPAKKATTAAITKVVGKLNNLPESKLKFVINIAKYVRKYAPQYGIKVYSPIIAQAIHESGWGESSLAYKYHNYFGMKCGTLWTGKSVNLSTKEEYTAGTLTTIRDNFRVYDNMEQGVKGYFEFISKPRYANLKGVTSPRQYLQNIKNDGYATGYLYVDHTMAVVEIYNLTQFDK